MGEAPTPHTLPLGLAERRAILVAGDLLVIAVLSAVSLRLGALRSGWVWGGGFVLDYLGWFAVLSSLWVGLAWLNGLYDPRLALDRWRVAIGSVKVSVQILVLWAIAYFLPPPWTLVRHVVVFFTALAALAMPLWRQVFAVVFSRSAFRQRLLIVGAGLAGRTLLAAIRSDAPHDYEVAGFVDDDAAKQGVEINGVPVVGRREDLLTLARRMGVNELALAITHDLPGELLSILMAAREQGLTVTPMPVLYEAITGRVPVEHIGDHWAVALPLDGPGQRGAYRLVHRVLDLALAALGLALLALVLLPAAILIRLSSPGPVLYRQQRLGRGGRPFTLLKLRTMGMEAETDGPRWASQDDPRVTGVGRLLRRTRLDELPQVLNILRGDMSVVGPRPERPEFVAELEGRIPFYRARHAVRPGLTGWAGVHQGYAASADEALVKLQYDLYYIKHQSLALDVRILAMTLGSVLRLAGR